MLSTTTVGCATEADTVFCMTDTTGNNDCLCIDVLEMIRRQLASEPGSVLTSCVSSDDVLGSDPLA